ncbi:PAS domain-containing sensor histidine kinase [Archangium lansingense]|uniref:histidine kinase n=1 Tax=Archangium lansingense TaxID=2995310 RepID=A0ABT3ZWE3_9BACT|nr:ATP-binding protein [Archangium lansinium]MCY1073696.1 ATP-binding protein [Archangium lansinium]
MSMVAPPPSHPSLPTVRTGEGLAAEMLAQLFEHARPLVDALFAQVNEGVTVQAQDLSLCFANPAAARIMGATSPEELLKTGGARVFERYEMFDVSGHPLRPEQLPGRQVIAGESVPEMVLRFRDRRTGEERWNRVSAAPVRDARGQVVYAVNVFRDVTEMMRTQERLSLLAEAGELLSASLDLESTLAATARLLVPRLADWCAVHLAYDTTLSRQVAFIHRDPAKEELARRISELYPTDPQSPHGIHHVLRTGLPQLASDITDTMLAAVTQNEEHLRLLRELGLCSLMVVPLNARGRTLGTLTLATAESFRRLGPEELRLVEELARRAALAVDNARLYAEAKRAQARHEVALDAGRMGAWEWDIQAERVTWAPALERIHGIPEGSFGGSFEDYQSDMHPEDSERVLASIQSVVDELQPEHHVQYRIVLPDGRVRWLEAHGRLTLDEQGRPSRLTGVCTDVTERLALEEDARRLVREQAARAEAERARQHTAELLASLEKAQAELAQRAQELSRSNADLEQFAYVASHDLQEPLRMVASYVQLLSRRYKGKLDADADEFIRYAVDGATRMQALINDLLAFSRVGTRGKELVPVPLERSVERALSHLRLALQESGAEVKVEPLPWVMGDETQLAQLLQNLVGNAVKFRGEQPPRIRVSATREDDTITVAVEDNGIGIEPQYYERIFAIFQRLHGKEEYPGTGIGLSICKKIVERHGGRIWVESTPGQGSTFRFTLGEAATSQA